ncbi:uncharacterized protein LOC122052433 isoform X1 [Zingiber officinale]|uniref:uncharacterized protein LOC122052433 isoform X1 n=1 Tax=Zingiber officinale TaxID=94328 RepID=UPI001C4C4EEE|nr:uncharacterized protein LOC122052433 isoform X1 [Zingiber officinale]
MVAKSLNAMFSMAETLIPNCTRGIPSSFSSSRLASTSNLQSPSSLACKSAFCHLKFRFATQLRFGARKWEILAATTPASVVDDGSMSIDLRRFIDLNAGKWNGSFYQFDAHGNLLQTVSTKLSASSYGEDELISLIQTLYIKQPLLAGNDEVEWAEYKIKEANMFTIDKYQQIGFFPKERAFSLQYQTTGMLETVLRQGVLGEADIGEEFPKNLKIPSKWPSIVCENCLYSLEKDTRARAFHIMDPKGILEMLIVFVEERGKEMPVFPSCNTATIGLNVSEQDFRNQITPWLGRWEGHSVTKRSGVYGATLAEADTVALLEMDGNDHLIQDITSTASGSDITTNVHWTGTISDNMATFDGGFQLIFLPGGMCMGCPCDIGRHVAQLQPFHLEFCWMESLEKRQRLVRTYDTDGLVVSTTYFYEIKG